MARKPKVEDTTAIIDKEDHIIDKEFIELLDERFTNYAFAVMEDRALPDARDGLKPSQRRTLVAMNDLNLRSSGKTKSVQKSVVMSQVTTTLMVKQLSIQHLFVWRKIGHYDIH